jgi:hypothetical protein
MAEINLTQEEANVLIVMEKHRANEDHSDFLMRGQSLTLPLQSTDKREQFLLDLSRGRIDLVKVKMQNRGRQVVVLVRLDLGGAPHRNPDDEEIGVAHLHIYREGLGDKWAVPLPREAFRNPAEVWITFEDFLRFCNITQPPHVERGLFT